MLLKLLEMSSVLGRTYSSILLLESRPAHTV